jgi:hypothetical protein
VAVPVEVEHPVRDRGVHTDTNTIQAPNLARSAIAPETRAPVITANRPWNTAKRITGTVSQLSAEDFISDWRPTYCQGLPRRPAPTSSPNAREYPTSTQTTVIAARAPKDIMIMLSTLLERTIPP